MNKKELTEVIAAKAELTQKDAGKALAAFVDTVTETLEKGDKVTLTGFGTFEVRKHAARVGRNPQTGQLIEIKASKSPAFKAGKQFKDALNQVL